MNVLPVITRELRAQARQPFTFTLRLFGVGAMLAAASVFAFHYAEGPNQGAVMFYYLHLTLFLTIWILVPLSAADCISRERREGTLGLLFLTPLKPADIVIAKSVAHGLRALTLLLAILPVLTISFLVGGVSWQQASTSALSNLSAMCWALAAALVASAGTRSSLRATVGAIVFALCGLLAFVYVTGHIATLGARPTPGSFHPNIEDRLRIGFVLLGISPDLWMALGRSRAPGQFLGAILGSTGFSLVVLLSATAFAAWCIRRNWRDEPPPLWVQEVQRKFCTPVLWLNLFKRWMRWKIERNPVGWLEQRTWTGRLVTWAWFGIVISIYSAAFTDRNFFQNNHVLQMTLGWAMMGSMAASAAGSFRRERETGVLELLLVSPLSTRQIIGGRLRGLWSQFLPAVGLLLAVWFYFDTFFHTHDAVAPCIFFASTFFALPVIGLYFSVRSRNYIGAFLLTLLVGLGLPFLLLSLLRVFWALFENLFAPLMLHVREISFSGQGFGAGPIAAQLVLALMCWVQLCRRLERRVFPVERTAM